jgi:primosomal replication protein N''
MKPQHRVIQAYQQRLAAAVGRSPLLKSSISKTARLLDCSRLRVISEKLPLELLDAVVEGDSKKVAIDLRLRVPRPNAVTIAPGSGPINQGRPASPSWDDPRNTEIQNLYHLLDHRIRRHGEQARRQTGVHAVWLGYPLLYLVHGEGTARQWMLAPIFLWPVRVELDVRRQAHIVVGRDVDAGPAQLNAVMAFRIHRLSEVDLLKDIGERDLSDSGWPVIERLIDEIRSRLGLWPEIDRSVPLQAVPTASSLESRGSSRLYHAAVLGSFQTKDGPILKDLDELRNLDLGDGLAASFAQGSRLPLPSEEPPPPEGDRYIVSEADFSQERVIWKARRTPGLIVHGPPGTGKSQTIVNIIADALAHGRTVLMVCQKQAATRVVFERLRAAGLDSLCAEVNQPEVDYRAISQGLRNQVKALPRDGHIPATGSLDRQQLCREIASLEAELDRHARALHGRNARFGLSYRQMKEHEGTAARAFPSVRELPSLEPVVEGLSVTEVDELHRRVEKAGSLFRLADALNNPWRHRHPDVRPSATLRSDVETILKTLEEYDSQYLEHIDRFGPGIDQPTDPADFLQMAPEAMRRLNPLSEDRPTAKTKIIRMWLRAARTLADDELDRLAERCREAVILADRVKTTPLDPGSADRCEGLSDAQLEDLRDSARIVLSRRGRWWRFLSPAYWRAKAAIRSLRPGSIGEALLTSAESLQNHLEARRLRAQLALKNRSLIPEAEFTQEDERQQVQFPRLAAAALDDASWLTRAARDRTWLAELLTASLARADRPRLVELLARTNVSADRAPLLVAMQRTLDGLKPFFLPEGLAAPERAIECQQSIGGWVKDVAVGLDSLQSLMALDLERHQLEGPSLAALQALERYEQDLQEQRPNGIPHPPAGLRGGEYGRWWAALIQYTASQRWQRAYEAEHPELIAVTPEVHSNKVQQLRDLLHRKRKLEPDSIRQLWETRQAAYRNQPWAQMFALRSGKKNGGAKTLRQAIDLSLTNGLLEMRPCWLANPTAVSQVFPLKAGLFDLVIFDEASQCPIEQALPAIYRGKSLIVSGDEKQLPPTGFFLAHWKGLDDGDEEDDSDGESTEEAVNATARQVQQWGQDFMLGVEDLLQAAVGLYPTEAHAYLLIHYRSRHPSLIEFSNQAFYEGRLETPPSARGGHCDEPPIRYHHVNGIYRDRQNSEEARAVVALLREFWLSEGCCPTIGVVTFNKPQQELIENLIQEECLENGAFAVRYQEALSQRESNQDIGFFVRNLENVQGDERDVMIFSTTFGRNPQNKFIRNFGPVGQVGGERRLNVAVTRAKDQIIIVGSMPIGEISTALSSVLGPQAQLTPSGYLQLYLAYAQAITDGDRDRAAAILQGLPKQPPRPDPVLGQVESPFEQEVLETLQSWGLEVDCQVGDSGFRIDLAVRHREPPRGYALGIECDGATYHSDRSARARDVWREDILRRQGWTIYRIWSTRWWSFRTQEISRLKDAVEAALNR